MPALTFQQRLRAYLTARGDVPPTPEWYDGLSRPAKLLGTLVVGIVGMLATLPLVGLYLMVGASLSPWEHVVAGIVVFAVAHLTAKFLGGAVADTLLGVPREEL